MATLRQVEANRRNAQRSTGPRSAEGRAVSRLNALKSGIDAQLQVIKDEDPAALEALTAEYYDRWCPTTPEARALVDSLISNEWLLRRLRRAEAEYWDYRLTELHSDFTKNHHMLGKAVHKGEDTMTRLQRRLDSVERNYHRALKELQRLEADTPQIGFVPSTEPKPAPELPAPEVPEPAQPRPEPQLLEPDTPEIGFVPSIQPKPIPAVPEAPEASEPAQPRPEPQRLQPDTPEIGFVPPTQLKLPPAPTSPPQ